MKIPFKINLLAGITLLTVTCLSMFSFNAKAQDAAETKAPETLTYVRNTFGGNYIIDNQTVMVPKAKSWEFVIQHRFGTINNGYDDFLGIYGAANMRLGFTLTPINNLQVGFGFTKNQMLWDGNAKWAIMKQTTSGIRALSMTYFANFACSTLPKAGNFAQDIDRYSYFHQLIIARKISSKLSLQVAPSISYFNNVPRVVDYPDTVPALKNMHLALSAAGRYSLTDEMTLIVNYDQPLTQHTVGNPKPNVSFGFEFGTSGHTFQLFMGNYQGLVPQYNNVFNQNDFSTSRYCIGFNLTRRWYY